MLMNSWNERLLGASRCLSGDLIMWFASQDIDAWSLGLLPGITWNPRPPALLVAVLGHGCCQSLDGCKTPPEVDRAGVNDV